MPSQCNCLAVNTCLDLLHHTGDVRPVCECSYYINVRRALVWQMCVYSSLVNFLNCWPAAQ